MGRDLYGVYGEDNRAGAFAHLAGIEKEKSKPGRRTGRLKAVC